MFIRGQQLRFGANSPRLRAPSPGLLTRALTVVAGVAVLVVGFVVSIAVFATVAAIAVVAGVYLWWKTRALRRQLRSQPPGGHIIEGEVIREPESGESVRR